MKNAPHYMSSEKCKLKQWVCHSIPMRKTKYETLTLLSAGKDAKQWELSESINCATSRQWDILH